MRITFEILDKHRHDRDNFDCGSEELNSFLKNQANQRQKRHNAVTHVAVDVDEVKVPKLIYGYYTLSNYSLDCNILPIAEAKKMPIKEKIPSLKLGRLARNKLYSNPGFGKIILMEVFRKAVALSTEVGIYLIDVDILNAEVGKFYRQFGFIEFIDDNKHMFITIETLKKLFKLEEKISMNTYSEAT